MPRRRSSIVDDLVLLPWWVSAALAGIAYLALPAILPPPIVKGGIVGIVSLGLLAIAAISALRALKTAHMLKRQTGIESLRALPWKRFEDLLGEVYRRQGYQVEETLGGGADGGVDLLLRYDSEVTLVQCKRWSGKPVPVGVVREIYGILTDRRASAAKVVATTSFTPDAVAFARGKPIELVDSTKLLNLVRGVQSSGSIAAPQTDSQRDRLAPGCPRCDSEMKLREARRGANAGQRFWGCSQYPSCSGTRSL